MYQIDQLTDDAKQSQTLVLEDGTSFYLEIYYSKMQAGWFIQTLTYGTFTVSGIRIYNGPNILRQFKNKIPFGLSCFSKGKIEPMFKQSFSSGDSKLNIITAVEVAYYEEFLSV